MAIAPGTRIGPYEVTALIGQGGMGEVYRARDTRLKRDVALKILPDAFANDADRMRRFQREAELLASLNHPRIASIYGVEAHALVMELAEGGNIQGPLPVHEALRLAAQIADALEYAHERGVIHRDLKPANIKVAPDGSVKLLDFGLAKAVEDPSSSINTSDSPTLSLAATRAGVILGTAAYMSPEQAHGRPADRRSDIWSFGVVLYEMLSGKQAFTGESVSDTLAAILKLEPDWRALPADTPPVIAALLKRCLTKDRRQRLQAIGEARILIEDVLSGKSGADDRVTSTIARRGVRFAAAGWVAAGVLGAVTAATLWSARGASSSPPRDVVRLTAPLAVASAHGGMAWSRDGSRLAFVSGLRRQIHVRDLNAFEARAIPGIEEASLLSFSPDGQWLSFISGEQRVRAELKKVPVGGGPAQTLANVGATVGPPTQYWAADQMIYFTDDGVLKRLPALGGTVETLATPDAQKGERSYVGGQLLPEGHLLVSVNSGEVSNHSLVAFDRRTRQRKALLEQTGVAQYVPTAGKTGLGHLIYYEQRTASVIAVPFDASRLEVMGAPAIVLEAVQGIRGPFGLLAVSEAGTLAFVPGLPAAGAGTTLVWVDRSGAETPVSAPPRAYGSVRLSPDGHRVAASINELEDIWVYDLDRGTLDRITTEGRSTGPVWTPDGKRLIYEHRLRGSTVVSIPVDRSGPPSILVASENLIAPSSVSPDGKVLLGGHMGAPGLWSLSLQDQSSSPKTPQPFLDTRSLRFNPVFSPDGHWVAYRSNETGRFEVYVAAYPSTGGRFPISTDGGGVPRWSPSGRELFYRNGDKMMVVDIETTPSFRASRPRVLFEGVYGPIYDVAPDGQRFLMLKPPIARPAAPDRVNILLNWFDELRRLAPVQK